MTTTETTVLTILEIISLVMIWRLWRRGRKRPFLFRCLWTLVLLVPVVGPLFYGFTAVAPEDHGERLPEYPPPDGNF